MSRLSTWEQLGGSASLARTEPLRRRLTLVVALIGCAVGSLGGGLPMVLSLLAAVGIGAGRWQRARLGPLPPRSWTRWRVLNVVALIGCGLSALGHVPPLSLGVGLVAWLAVHRAWTGSGAADDRVALLLALLQALLGCILTVSALLAPLFALLVLLAPIGLALCHLGLSAEDARARRQRPGGSERLPRGLLAGLAPITAVLTLLFFVCLPRLDGGASLGGSSADRVTGFGQDVDIGDLGDLLESDQIVLRLRVTDDRPQPSGGALYLRGAALDSFDGQRWSTTVDGGGTWRPRPGVETSDPATLVRQEVYLEPISEPVIFGLATVIKVRGAGRSLVRDGNEAIRYRGAPVGLHYMAWSLPPTSDPARLASARADPRRSAQDVAQRRAAVSGAWLQLPEQLDPRVRRLADEIVARAGPRAGAWQKAVTLAAYLQHDYHYSLSPPQLPGGVAPADPLAWFLFDARQGHCEYFATALAVMLRTQGIPARVVNGFLGGELNPLDGWLVVRQRDAHSWVELNLGEEGWVTLDATPAGGQAVRVASAWGQADDWLTRHWRSAILDYDLSDQMGALATVGRALQPAGTTSRGELELPELGGVIAMAVLLVIGALSLRLGLAWLARAPRKRRKRPRGRVGRLHARAWARVKALGWTPPVCLPPGDAAAWLRNQIGPAADPLCTLSRLHYSVAYGGVSDASLTAQAEAAWAVLRRDGLPKAPDHKAGQPRRPDAHSLDQALHDDDMGQRGAD